MRWLVLVALVAGCGGERVPHLVVAATGEDLGEYVSEGSYLCAFSPKASWIVCYEAPSVAFDAENCTGHAYGRAPVVNSAVIANGQLFGDTGADRVSVSPASCWVFNPPDGTGPHCFSGSAGYCNEPKQSPLENVGMTMIDHSHAELEIVVR